MVSITISIPEEIRKIMKQSPEVNWSALVRKVITEKAKQLAIKEELLKQLQEEKEFEEWAVDLVRKGRRDESSS